MVTRDDFKKSFLATIKLTKVKEEINNQTIESYIKKLIASYGLYPIVNESALKIQFDHGLYAECVLEIMRKMGLQNKVKVTCYADYKYPCPTSVARIHLPLPLPFFGSQNFNAMRLHVEMKESIKKDFYAFVSSVVHELSHVVMFGMNHELRESEVATDLCMLVFGFSDFVIKGKKLTKSTISGYQIMEMGYLSTLQLQHAVKYIDQLRKAPKPKQHKVEDYSIENLLKLFKDFKW